MQMRFGWYIGCNAAKAQLMSYTSLVAKLKFFSIAQFTVSAMTLMLNITGKHSFKFKHIKFV